MMEEDRINRITAPPGPQPNLTSRIATMRGCTQSRCHASVPPMVATLTPCHKIGCKIVHSVQDFHN